MRAFVVTVFFVLAAGVASAFMAAWPATDVAVTLPAAEGSESDAYFALFKDSLTSKTGKAVTPRRIPGQAGGDAWAKMADDPPDGSVVTNILLPNLFLRTYLQDSGVYPDNMAVCHVGAYSPCVLWVPSASAFDSVAALTEAARNTSGNFFMGGAGRYSVAQVAARAFDRQSGIRTTYVPYADGIAAAKAALNRDVTAFWGYSVPPVSSAPSALTGASFKALAVAAENRLPAMPDVPTFRELGIDLVEGVYLGIAVPKDTSEAYRETISEAFSAIARESAYISGALAVGLMPLDIRGQELETLYGKMREKAAADVEEYSLTEQ
ncbi:MAG: hypothetical protein DELT_00061 [Desulfovibrio sp.]